MSRATFDARVSPYDAATTFFPAWKAAVQQGGARGVMCSYNEYNGVPACGDAWLLRDVLRRGWGFDGYVTSDSGAVEWIYEPDAHNYTATPEEGVALALRAGTDVDSNLDRGDHATGSPYVWYFNASRDAGLISEADVDAARRE